MACWMVGRGFGGGFEMRFRGCSRGAFFTATWRDLIESTNDKDIQNEQIDVDTSGERTSNVLLRTVTALST
jgi:hypothetical protein